MKKRIRFIINPLSGGKNKDKLPEIIRVAFEGGEISAEVHVSKSRQDTIDIARDAVRLNFDAVVACGGDGTINNIASLLINTNVALGIIPMGSGNGFSRDLHIPFNVNAALETIRRFHVKTVDTAEVNTQPFINISGVGFDAHIAGLFHSSKRRGLKTYAQIVLREFNNYKGEFYRIVADGKELKTHAFLIAVTNGTQFGNNARISPLSDFTDGLLEVTIIKRCRWIDVPMIAIRLFNGTLNKHPQVVTYCAKNIEIFRNSSGIVNIDGEPESLPADLKIRVVPASLKVIVPSEVF